jgi:hypothetical protein
MWPPIGNRKDCPNSVSKTTEATPHPSRAG